MKHRWAPAEWPKSVTWSASPPYVAALSMTNVSASLTSRTCSAAHPVTAAASAGAAARPAQPHLIPRALRGADTTAALLCARAATRGTVAARATHSVACYNVCMRTMQSAVAAGYREYSTTQTTQPAWQRRVAMVV